MIKKKVPHSKKVVRRVGKSRLDVLLVYPIWVKKGGRGKLQNTLPPLGILSLASYLEKNGYEVQVVDLHAEELSPDEFRMRVRHLQPRHIGISVLSAHFVSAHHIAYIAREEVPDSRIYAGGVHAEIAPEDMLKNPAFDAVCRGDGEETLLELIRGIHFKDIPGLSFRNNFRVVHNAPRSNTRHLDAYPHPAYHLIEFDRYFPPAGSYRDLPAMNVLMTRGCPGKCTFCNSANTILRSRSVPNMISLIKKLRYEYGIRQIYFYDDTFTANVVGVRQFCHSMIREKIDVKWICYVRGDMFKESIAELMAKAGCHQVLIGVESGSAKLMKAIGKPINKEKYIQMVKIAHKYKIEVRASFIIGHELETAETLKETLDFAKEMDVDLFQLSIMTPYPGTQLFSEAKRNNRLLHEDYSRYGQNEVVLKMRYLEPDDIIAFEKRAFYQFYFRPKIIFRQLKRLTNWPQVRDLLKAVYIIFLEGLGKTSLRSKAIGDWLEFDVQAHVDRRVVANADVRITYQVRQNPIPPKESPFSQATAIKDRKIYLRPRTSDKVETASYQSTQQKQRPVEVV